MAVLMIGGMDSSGGAGLLRDCATAADFGVATRVAVTAVTAQTDAAVLRSEVCSAEMVRAQIAAAIALGPVKAVKIGMLGTAEVVRVVAAALPDVPEVPVVLDPVVAASSGRELLDAEGLQALLSVLLPKVSLITPNLPELALLADRLGVGTEGAGSALLDRGAKAVLVKGGHAAGAEAVDHLITREGTERFASPRRPGSRRGTGCSLAAAIACGLAQGQELPEAVGRAKAHVQSRFG